MIRWLVVYLAVAIPTTLIVCATLAAGSDRDA